MNRNRTKRRTTILFQEIEFETLGEKLIDRLKAVGRSKIFDSIGTIFALLSVLLVTVRINSSFSVFLFVF